jgi:hypothetical protein
VRDLNRRPQGFSLDAEETPTSGTSPRWRRLALRVLAGVAILVQSVLVLIYVGMGLGWFGLLYVVNLVQGVVFLALAVLTAVKRPALALAMPVISFGLMLACYNGDQLLTGAICPPDRLSAATELGPVPGHSESPEFEHEWGRCVARFNSGLPQASVMEQYRFRAQQAGWEVQMPPSDREVVMSNATTTVKVVVNWNDRGMFVMTEDPRRR